MDTKTFISDYRKGIPLQTICQLHGYDRREALKLIDHIKHSNKVGKRMNQSFKELVADRFFNGASIDSISLEVGSAWRTVRNWIDEIVEQRYGKIG